MALIEREAVITLIEQKQKELCPVGMFSRHAVYGTDRDRFDTWDEIIDQIDALSTIDATVTKEPRGGINLQDNKVCNQCGKELDFWDIQENFTIHSQIGYGSIHDGDDVHLQLCCDCFDKLVEDCKVNPIMEVVVR